MGFFFIPTLKNYSDNWIYDGFSNFSDETFENFVAQKAFNRHFTEKSVAMLIFQENSRISPNFFSSLKILATLKNVGLPHFSRLRFWRRKNFVKCHTLSEDRKSVV